jgi:hypothetical protein
MVVAQRATLAAAERVQLSLVPQRVVEPEEEWVLSLEGFFQIEVNLKEVAQQKQDDHIRHKIQNRAQFQHRNSCIVIRTTRELPFPKLDARILHKTWHLVL